MTTVLRASAGQAPLIVTLSDFGAGSSAVLSGLTPDHFSLQVTDVTITEVPALMLTASPDAAGYGAPAIITLAG